MNRLIDKIVRVVDAAVDSVLGALRPPAPRLVPVPVPVNRPRR